MREVSAIQRQQPDSPRDFSFKITTSTRSVLVDPGNGATYRRWEEGLLTAMSLPRAALRRAASRCSQ
eukprot:395724-Prymnesium_polylepis.1